MATKAKAAPSKSKTGTSMVKWDEVLAARAAIAKKTVESVATGNFISLKGGIMAYQGNVMEGNQLDAVILSNILENNFFPGKYDPNTPATPICFAFGTDEKDMKPHEKSVKPQAASCSACPHNEWGTGDGGKGKACKNVFRLGLITADSASDPDEIKEANVAYLKTPVTSGKAWAGFVKGCAAQNKPPLAYVTRIAVTPDPKTQFKVSFKAVEEISDGDVIGALVKRGDEVDKTIDFPYQPTENAAAGKGKAAGKAAPAAKGKRKF